MAIILFDDPFEFTTQDFVESVAGFIAEEDTERIDHILHGHTDEYLAEVFNDLLDIDIAVEDFYPDELMNGPVCYACEDAVNILAGTSR